MRGAAPNVRSRRPSDGSSLVGSRQNRFDLVEADRAVGMSAAEYAMHEVCNVVDLLARHLDISQPLRERELRDEASHAIRALARRGMSASRVERNVKGACDWAEPLRVHTRHETHRMWKRDARRDAVRNVPSRTNLMAERMRQAKPGVRHPEH